MSRFGAETKASSVDMVAQHYGRRTQDRHENKGADRKMMQNICNYARRILVSAYRCRGGSGGGAAGGEGLMWLDLAGGHGGVLSQVLQPVKCMVNIDVTAASLDEAQRRFSEMSLSRRSSISKLHTVQGNAFDTDTVFKILDDQRIAPQFDVVSCYFALHYAAAPDTPTKGDDSKLTPTPPLVKLATTVKMIRNLCKQGTAVFSAMILDSAALLDAYDECRENKTHEWKRTMSDGHECKIVFDSVDKEYEHLPTGLPYSFTSRTPEGAGGSKSKASFVENCTEYVLSMADLVDHFKSQNMTLLSKYNLGQWLKGQVDTGVFFGDAKFHPTKLPETSADWDALSLYCMVEFGF